MKWSFIGIWMQCLFLSVLIAGNINAQEVKSVKETEINANFSNSTLTEIFNYIEYNTEFEFSYDHKDLRNDLTFNLNQTNATVADILYELSKVSGLKFKQVDNLINVSKRKKRENFLEVRQLQERTITGTVTSEDSPEGLPGVNVLVKGTSTGTVTDIDGNYSIDVPSNEAILSFSSVGYLKEEIVVGDRSVVNLVMTPDIQQLKELVVVGYGAQTEKSLSSAVSRVSGEDLQDIQVESIDNALQGKVAGINVRQTSGQPGAGLHVTIRGIGSEAGSNPLWVIDGVQIQGSYDELSNPLQFLDPKDIESINVLKDASSAAIYGAQASGGVILVETKKGKKGKKASINFRASFGTQDFLKSPDVLNPEEYAQAMIDVRNRSYVDWHGHNINDDDATRRANVGGSAQIGIFQAWQNGESVYEPEDRPYPFYLNPEGTVWHEEILNESPYIQDYQIAVNGGTENSSYYISGSYRNNKGLLKGWNGFERYSVRANYTTEISDKIEMGLNLNPSYVNQGAMLASGRIHKVGIWPSAMASSPITSIFEPDGSYQSNITGSYSGIQNNENPILKATQVEREFRNSQILGRMYLKFDIIDGLTFQTSFAGNYKRKQYRELWPETVGIWGSRAPTNNTQEHSMNSDFKYQFTEQLTYNKTIAENHDIQVTGVFEAIKNIGNELRFESKPLPNAFLTTFDYSGDFVDEAVYGESAYALASFIGRVNYAFKDKYFFTASLRRDGSTRFGPESQWGNFPAFSGAWAISDEPFFNIPQVDLFKVKASWGKVGNHSGFGNYRWQTTVNSVSYLTGSGENVTAGYTPLGAGNPSLKWEGKESINVGFTSEILNNRVAVDFDYYKDINVDFINSVGVPEITGFNSVTINFGEMETQGVDLNIQGRVFEGDFRWNTTFNFATQSSKVVNLELDEALDRDINGGNFINEVNAPYGNLWFQVYDGVYDNFEEIATSPIKENSNNVIPGAQKIKDINMDGVLSGEDKMVVGNSFPKYLFGFTNDFAYKNFTFSVHAQAKLGAHIWDRTWEELTGPNTNMLREFYYNSWTGEGSDYKYPAIYRAGGPPGFGTTSMDVFNTNYLAIRNMTLAYNLPKSVLDKIGGKSLRLSFTVQNVAMFTKEYPFSNPEGWGDRNGGTDDLSLDQFGTANGSYPLTRTYMFGLNFSL